MLHNIDEKAQGEGSSEREVPLPMTRQDIVRFEVRVKPGAKSSSVGGTWGETEALNISVHEQPTDGKANGAVLDLLATVLKVKKRQLTIVRGLTHRTKVIQISDATQDTHNRLEYWKAKG